MVLCNPELKDQSLWYHKELANEYIEKAEKLAMSYGIRTKFYKKFNLNTEYQKDETEPTRIDCHFLWEEAWIRVNDDVVLCCNIDVPVVGNIYGKKFNEI